MQIAVVGSGVAAMMAVRTLSQLSQQMASSSPSKKSFEIVWFTSRGKLATQMGPKNQTPPQEGKPYFDYGCQYLAPDGDAGNGATSDIFRAEVERWVRLGLAQALPDGAVGVIHAKDNQYQRTPLSSRAYVGNGGMGILMQNLIQQTVDEFSHDGNGGTLLHQVSGFPNQQQRVVGLSKRESQWFLHTKQQNQKSKDNNTSGPKSFGPFDIVIGAFGQHVLTDPFLQSGGRPAQNMLQALRRLESNQIIAVQLILDGSSVTSLGFTAAHVRNDKYLSFVSNNSAKPQQSGQLGTPGPEHWTLLSTAAFAETEFHQNPKGYRKSAEHHMLTSFTKLIGIPSLEEFQSKYRPSINRINHWEDALPVTTPPGAQGCLLDVHERIGWCGDFCVAPSVDGAAQSGVRLAQVVHELLLSPKATDEPKILVDEDKLLPFNVEWIPMKESAFTSTAKYTTVDIGSFGHSPLELPAFNSHTNLVPSAIDGYQKQKAHFGAGRRLPKTGSSAQTRKRHKEQKKKTGSASKHTGG